MTYEVLKDDLEFLHLLGQQGITLRDDGDSLVCTASVGVMTQELCTAIADRKSRLLPLLSAMRGQEGLPHLEPDPAARYEPFALTENQEAYWLGRNTRTESGGVGIHVFFEIGVEGFDTERFEAAWDRVVRRHDMLRAVVMPDGRQRILENPGRVVIEEEMLPATGEDVVLAQARHAMSHTCYDLSVWPQTCFKVFRQPAGEDGTSHGILMWSLDTWNLDLRSVQVILDDLTRLYRGEEPRPPVEVSFRDYVAALGRLRKTSRYRRALDYWRERIRALPCPPDLPRQPLAERQAGRFTRRSRRLPAEVWQPIRDMAARHGLTTPVLLLAAYAATLSRWSVTKHFTLNVPRFNRLPLHPDIDHVVGEFASFSLLEVDCRERRPFVEHARGVQSQLWKDLEHAHVSGVRVLREWREYLGPAAPAVMAPFVFTSEPEQSSESAEPDDGTASSTGYSKDEGRSWIAALERLGTVRELMTQTPQVWLDSQFSEVEGGLYLSWDSLDGLFPEGMVDRMFDAYVGVVEGLAEEEGWTRAGIPLPPSELALRGGLLGPSGPVPDETPWEAIQRHARIRPHARAVVDARGGLDWSEVRFAIDRRAGHLVELGVGPGHVVAFALPKGREQLITAMAIHACGATGVPLDHESPVTRARVILSDCGAVLLFTDAPSRARLHGAVPCPVLDVDDGTAPVFIDGLPSPDPAVSGLYCIIYTSGSTGTPKGVMVPLQGLLNMAQDARERFALGPADVVLSLSPVYHDLALFDMLVTALFGVTLVFPDPARLKDPAHWLARMAQCGVTVWNTVPATMTMLLDYLEGGETSAQGLATLRWAVLGGDWLPLGTPGRLAHVAPGAVVVSSGGPTEISVWNMLYPVMTFDQHWRSIPYGLPIRNAGCHILDERLEDCPAMVPGEMYASGVGITAGYMNDPERTSASFVVHPGNGLRMYRTSDIVRLHHDGYVEFIGRRDNQVNVNGYRIELGEVETAACLLGTVGHAVAVLPAVGPDESKGLVLWVVPAPGQMCTEADVRTHLAAHVPKYMMPAYIGVTGAFPLTRNGKTDRVAMSHWPLPDKAKAEGAQDIATPTEALLAEAWRQTLGLEAVSPDDNFFEVGGSSIAAVRLYNRVIAGRYPGLSVASLFSFPTIRELAAAMDAASPRSAGDSGAVLPPVGHRGATEWPAVVASSQWRQTAPATRVQQRMFYEDARQQGAGCYNMCLRVDLRAPEDGAIDVCLLEAACNAVVARHDILRTVFVETPFADAGCETCVMQHIRPVGELSAHDWGGDADRREPGTGGKAAFEVSAGVSPSSLEALCRDFTVRPYDLSAGPLVRFGLLLERPDKGVLLIGFHHIVMDGWSLGLFMNDFAAALDGLANPVRRAFPDGAGMADVETAATPVVRQSDVALWERSQAVADVARRIVPRVAARFPEGGNPSVIPAAISVNTPHLLASGQECCVEQAIPDGTVAAINALCPSLGCTPFAFMLTVFALLTSRYGGDATAQLGTYVAARTLPGLESAFGSMTCPAPLRFDFTSDMALTEAVRGTMRQLSEAMDHCLLPFDDIIKAIGGRKGGDLPLFGIAFTYDNTPSQAVTAAGLHLSPAGIRQYRTSIDLEAAVAADGEGMRVGMVFNPERLDVSAVRTFMRRFIVMLERAVALPGQLLSALSHSTPEDEALRVLHTPPSGFPEYDTLLGYLRAIAQARPEGTAFVDVGLCDGRPVAFDVHTVSDVVSRVDAMTAALMRHGVLPGDRVALFLPRSASLAVAMLATQQCGAVFVPVPLGMARSRIVDIFSASGAVVVCCEGAQLHAVADMGATALVIDGIPPLTALEREALHAPGVLPEPAPDTEVSLFFTSGSEGSPKGVRLSHRNWVNRIEAGWRLLPYTEDEVCIAKTGIGFIDIFCELFQPLFRGIPVYVVREGEETDVEALVAHLEHWGVTRAMIVVSLIGSILDTLAYTPARLESLRHVLASGEPLPAGMVHRFRERLPQCDLYNTYGSTEVSADVVSGPVIPARPKGGVVPLGRPMLNCRVEVLDTARRPLPHGVPGEVAVAGPAVTPGYADGDTTRFIEVEGERFFLTGDVGMWTAEGELLGFGRMDRQLKIRGQRVEPGDVEEVIRAHAHVSEVAVIGMEEAGEMRLAACVVLTTPGAVAMRDLRRDLHAGLSGAMMPACCVEVESIPRTGSGKVDRRALTLAVEAALRAPTSDAAPPEGDVEKTLADIWSQLLGHPVCDRQENFFGTGGHSLLAVRLVALIRERFGVRLQVRHIFDTPVLADLADLVGLLVTRGGAQADTHHYGETEVI